MQKVNNPNFLDEAGEYLEANGYKRYDQPFNTILYARADGDLTVAVRGDNVDILTHHDGEPDQCKSGYSRYMSFTGISDLNWEKWVYLFHVTDVVPLKEFARKAAKEMPETNLIQDLFSHIGEVFRTAGSQVSVSH